MALARFAAVLLLLSCGSVLADASTYNVVACAESAVEYNAVGLVACQMAAKFLDHLSDGSETDDSEYIMELLKWAATSPDIYGCAVAFTPPQAEILTGGAQQLYSPYMFENITTGEITYIEIGTDAYNYTDASLGIGVAWYFGPLRVWEATYMNSTTDSYQYGVGTWSPEYFDAGAGNVWMRSFGVAFGTPSEVYGVVSMDVLLDAQRPPPEDAALAG